MEPLPEHLGHKPVYAMPYEDFDGIYAGQTDIRYLSVGLAQYDATKVSVKTMRHTGEKWSRQAEELPAHRIIDMTTFLAMVLCDCEGGSLTVPAGTFENQTSDLLVTENRNRSGFELSRYRNFIAQHGPELKERLSILADVLTELKVAGKL